MPKSKDWTPNDPDPLLDKRPHVVDARKLGNKLHFERMKFGKAPCTLADLVKVVQEYDAKHPKPARKGLVNDDPSH